uniref:Uncharacterized protein LOC113792413 n=1 Tax=Dermatophagoides pteronyssinus TaxID=6956 RepID=A0A6P6XXQ0_DERPT|nr:uncharacterized protein LOC113792413 [Dermatophagoides pteronyssinus]
MDEIKKVLDQHYGGRHQIIPALTRKIQSAPYLSARPQLKDYEEMLEVVISIVDTLNLTNLKSEDYHLSTFVMSKIDEIHHHHIGDEYELNLDHIEKFLRRGLNRKQALTARMNTNPYIMRERQRVINGTQPSNGRMTTNPNGCFFQDGDHTTDECQLTMDQRRQFIMSNRLCLKCGQEGHNSRECATTNRCHICGRNHVSFLCYQRTTIHRRTETDRSVNNQSRSSTAAEPVATSSQPSLLIQNGRSMHKTLVTEINGETVRVVFDEGASSSFVSSRLAEKWNVEKIRTEPIVMETLSNTGPTTTGHLMIKVKIPTWGGRHKELGFRINDKVDKLKFECIEHQSNTTGGRTTTIEKRNGETNNNRMGGIWRVENYKRTAQFKSINNDGINIRRRR